MGSKYTIFLIFLTMGFANIDISLDPLPILHDMDTAPQVPGPPQTVGSNTFEKELVVDLR